MIFLLHLQSTLSVALVSVALLSSNLWMTVLWSGHFFTRPLMVRCRGFLSGSVVVEHPLRFLTSLRWMQLRVLCVPLHLPSSLTDPLVVQCVSASPVSVWFRTILQFPIQWHPPPSSVDPPDWFSHGPLSCFDSLYGWGSSRPSPPGSGTQSWLFCPLISLGLALAESNRGFLLIPLAVASKFLPSNPSSGAPMLRTSSKLTTPISSPSTVNNPPRLPSNRGKGGI